MRTILGAIVVAVSLAAPDVPAWSVPPEEDESALVQRLTIEELVEWRGLRYTMSDFERRMYLSRRTPKERREWLERFWLGLDPTPTTPVNERRLEHEQRVELARTMFPRRGGGGWDARGETLIRFGLPDARHSIQGEVTFSGAAPPREIWFYQRLNVIVTFEDPMSKNEYTLSAGQARLPTGPGRRGPDSIDYTADPDIAAMEARARDLIGEIDHEKYLEALNNYFVCRDAHQSIYTFDLRDPLTVYFDVVSYRTPGDSLMTEVCLEIPLSEIGLVEANGMLGGDVSIDVLVRDPSLNPVATARDTIHVALPSAVAKRPSLVPARFALALRPGFYSLAIEAHDRHSRRAAGLSADISVGDCGGSPDMSDIRFASSIQPSDRPNAFTRDGLDIVPHPIHAYRIPFPLTLYFEIYGLSVDDDGRSSYRVEYTIAPRQTGQGGKSRGAIVVTSAFESNGAGSRQTQPLQIDTTNLWQGAFELSVKITDRRTDRSAVKTARFSVLES